MKYSIYCIHDSINGFMTPNTDLNDPSAVRNFSLAVNQVGSVLNHKPEDFSLYRIGEFDSKSGEVTACIPPVFVVDGVSLIREVK